MIPVVQYTLVVQYALKVGIPSAVATRYLNDRDF